MYVIAMAVSMAFARKLEPISSRKGILLLSPVLTCLGTVMLVVAYRQSFVDAWSLANIGGFITGIGTAWLSLAWGELFGSMGMEETGKLVTLSLFLGVVLNYVLISVPTFICIPTTVLLPAASMLMLQQSLKTHPIAFLEPLGDSVVSRALPWRLIVNIGAIAITFGYLRGIGLTGEVYSISPYVVFIGIAVMSFAFAFWTNVLHRNLNTNLVYRGIMLVLIASFMTIPFLDETTLGWTAAAVTACYDCFDMVIWTVMANIVALTAAPAIRIFGFGRMSNHLGMLIGVFLGLSMSMAIGRIPSLSHLMTTVIVFILVLCVFAALREVSFFTTPPALVSRMSDSNKDIDVACARIAKQYGLTSREEDVLKLLGRGRNAAYIAETLVISDNTAKAHAKHIYRKLGVNTQQQLIDLTEL